VAPGLEVVDLGPGEGAFAALGGAGVVGQGEGAALGGGVQASFAAEVEGFGAAAQDGGDDAGAAGEAAGFAGGDPGAGVELLGPGQVLGAVGQGVVLDEPAPWDPPVPPVSSPPVTMATPSDRCPRPGRAGLRVARSGGLMPSCAGDR
jgi:hypothetical protein